MTRLQPSPEPTRPRRLSRAALGCAAVAVGLGLIGVDGFLIEPHWLKVSRLTLASRKIASPVRIVVLADVQTDRPGPYEARAFEAAMAQSPDLVLFAGDYVQLGRRSGSYGYEIEALNEVVRDAGLSAPLGIYAIEGNVDRSGAWPRVFDGTPAVTIEATSRYDLGPLVLTGLSVRDSFSRDTAVEGEDAFHVVLGHSPNFGLGSVDADLLIAGHTHGGQVRLPLIGPLITFSAVPRRWAAGVTEIAPGTTLVVSRGIGMERGLAPRVRFLCRPELVVIDLVPTNEEWQNPE
jgi:uncharacterized protein